jgi:hypothetical protein
VLSSLEEGHKRFANSDPPGDEIDHVRGLISERVGARYTATLSRCHYRCLDWFFYRITRRTSKSLQLDAARRLADRVHLLGVNTDPTPEWDRDSCPLGVAGRLWCHYEDVRNHILNYLDVEVANRRISDDDRRHLITMLERHGR